MDELRVKLVLAFSRAEPSVCGTSMMFILFDDLMAAEPTKFCRCRFSKGISVRAYTRRLRPLHAYWLK